MSRLYLPLGKSNPYQNPKDERESLLSRLWESRYIIPNPQSIELSYLQDIVQYAERRFIDDELKNKLAAEAKIVKMGNKQIKGALSEFMKWRRKKEVSQGLRSKEELL